MLFMGAIFSRYSRIFGIALVAVFDAAQIAPVGFCVFQEGHEVGHADDVDGASDAVAVKRRDRQRHVVAVATAGNGNAIGIKIRYPVDPRTLGTIRAMPISLR